MLVQEAEEIAGDPVGQLLFVVASFGAFAAARYVRRRTPRSQEILQRIKVARAFTCYQVLALLRNTPDSPHPKIIMGLLSTFRDESVSPEEGRRLLEVVVSELHRLRRSSAVAVSVRDRLQPERQGLVDFLVSAADRVRREEIAAKSEPARLF